MTAWRHTISPEKRLNTIKSEISRIYETFKTAMIAPSCWCVSVMPSLWSNFLNFPPLILPQHLSVSSFSTMFHLEHWHRLPPPLSLCFTGGGGLTLPPGPAITQNLSPIVRFWFPPDVPRPQPPSSSHFIHISLFFSLVCPLVSLWLYLWSPTHHYGHPCVKAHHHPCRSSSYYLFIFKAGFVVIFFFYFSWIPKNIHTNYIHKSQEHEMIIMLKREIIFAVKRCQRLSSSLCCQPSLDFYVCMAACVYCVCFVAGVCYIKCCWMTYKTLMYTDTVYSNDLTVVSIVSIALYVRIHIRCVCVCACEAVLCNCSVTLPSCSF